MAEEINTVPPEATSGGDASDNASGAAGDDAPTDLRYERDIKTQFPVARIKRLMQSDEDVGKVAQATPVVVAKALELFMVHIVEAACKQASDQQVKRVNMQHLYNAVMEEEKFDFIRETIEKSLHASQEKK